MNYDRGEVAYNAFKASCESMIGRDEDKSFPEFSELHPDIKNHWQSVADAVCSRFGAIY